MTEHLYDASLYDEAQQLNKRTSREDLTTNTLVESLAFSRDAVTRLDAEFEEHVADYKEAMKPFEADRKALKAIFEGAAKKFEERLLAILKRDKALPKETNNGVTLTIALLPRIGFKKGAANLDEIPSKYLLPIEQCIDWKAVQAAHKAGEELPPWVEQFDQVSLRTKLPEVTE